VTAGQDGGRGREETICCPSLDSVPEAVHASEHGVVGDEEVSSLCEYGEEEPDGDTVAEEGSDACPWGGEAFDEGEDCLG